METTRAARQTHSIAIHDRRISFDLYGSATGYPVIYCHGSPGSRFEWPMLADEDVVLKAGVKLIVPDRPGMGLSDPQPGRQLMDWAADCAALADELALQRFSLLGISGGCPYALATAVALPERVASVGILSGVAPYDVPSLTDGINADALRTLKMAVTRPGAFQMIWRIIALLGRLSPSLMARQAASVFAAPDKEILKEPSFARRFSTMLRGVLQQGPRGLQQDVALMVSPWGFDPERVQAPVFWQGDRDTDATPAMARFLADKVQGAHLRIFEGEGHISLAVNYMQDALQMLTCLGRAQA